MKRALATSWIVVLGLVACERYDAPPTPTLEGLDKGILDDPRAPVVVDFGSAIDPATLKIQIALNETDVEGNLYDEDADPNTKLHVVPTTVAVDGARATLTGAQVFPVGPKLVLIIEGGLESTTHEISHYRVKVPFAFGVKCTGGATSLASGRYFMLLQVEKPVGVQIQVFADLTIDPATGALAGTFTNADRRTDETCPMACTGGTVCRLLPSPGCVLPSEPAASVDEAADWVAFGTPPLGFSFTAEGCAVGDAISTAPATLAVEQPPVTAVGLTLNASFTPDGHASGTLTADQVLLGTSPIGAGNGSMTARKIQ